MRIQNKFTYHTDDGHGWLEVDASWLPAIGLTPEAFSKYSYMKVSAENPGITYYLEEDCDSPIFVRAFTEKYGHEPRTTESHDYGTHWIRRLESMVL